MAVRALAYAPDGKTLASAGSDGRIILWDRAAGKAESKRLEGKRPFPVYALAFAPDGRHLVLGNGDGTAYVLRLGLPAN